MSRRLPVDASEPLELVGERRASVGAYSSGAIVTSMPSSASVIST